MTSMPSGHDGGVHIIVGPQRPAPPELPAAATVPALPAAPEVPPVPAPEGCSDPPSHPATQTTASARAGPSAPSERLDPPEADVLLPFRPTTRSRMAGFRTPAKRPGARRMTSKRPGSAQLPRRGPTVIPDTADLCGELPYKA